MKKNDRRKIPSIQRISKRQLATIRNPENGGQAIQPKSQIRAGLGGDEGIRTPDLYVANVPLSQLSYIPTFSKHSALNSLLRHPASLAY
jgi:hypothetical protein